LDTSSGGVYAQHFAADGGPLGGQFRVNENVSSNQYEPAITALDGGGFVVSWRDDSGRDGSGTGVFAQQYDAAANRVDGEFQVNSEFSSTQSQVALAGLSGDNFVAVWRSQASGTAGDGSGGGIFQQLFGDPADFDSQASPVLSEFASEVTFSEAALNAGPLLLDSNQSVYLEDGDSADFDGGSLLVTRFSLLEPLLDQFESPDDGSQDQLGIQNQGTGTGQIGVNGSNVTYQGVVIGSLASDGSNSSRLEVTFNNNADAEAVEALVEQLTYANISDDPVPSRQFRIQLSDGDGGTSEPVVIRVNISPEQDGVNTVFGERQINSFVEGEQREPSVASLADGGYVVVWESDNEDGSGYGIFAQRYTAEGVITGPAFIVNSQVFGDQIDAQVTGLAGGGFVVSWTDQVSNADGSSWGIFAQRFDADGLPTGNEFQVNSTASSSQQESAIAALNDGGFVAVWRDDSGSDGSSAGVQGQRFDAVGNPVGAEFQVNTEFSSFQYEPSVSGLNGGGFVVTWTSYTSGTAGDGSGQGIFAQRYDADGNPVGGEFQVNTEVSGDQRDSVVAGLADGTFVVAWTDQSGLDTSSGGVYAQHFAADGGPLGGQFRVNENVSSNQHEPAITALDGGGFVVSWRDDSGRDGSGTGVFAQQYDAAANRVDGEFQVNSEISSTQSQVALAGLTGDNFVAVWRSQASGTAGDGSGGGIFQQLFGDPADFGTQASPELEGVNSDLDLFEGDVNASPQLLDANGAVALSDLDSSDFDGGMVLVSRQVVPVPLLNQFNAPDDATQDQLGVRNQGTGSGQIGVSGATVSYAGTAIGTISSDGSNGSNLQIDLNSNATVMAVESLIENLTYANTSNDPVDTRQFRIQVSDGDGGTSAPAVVNVNIIPEVDGVEAVGPEIQVNTETAAEQSEPSGATLSDGSYIVVWRSASSSGSADGSGFGIFGQRFAADGSVLGTEFQINTQALNSQDQPDVAALTGGGFVVTWRDQDNGTDGSSSAVSAQRFDSAGVPQGSEFVVNSTTTGGQYEPAIAGLSDGGFVIVYRDDSGSDGSASAVLGQRFDNSGNPVGGEFRVNTESGSFQYEPDVSSLAGGGFVVTWTSYSSGSAGDGSGQGIFAQRYDADGNTVGTEFQVNTEVSGDQREPVVAGLADGTFVVAWTDESGLDTSFDGVYAQHFAADGNPLGGQFRVNENVSSNQYEPAITALDGGGFVVSWRDDSGRDGSGAGVFGQQYDASAERVDGEFQINTEFSSSQYEPALTYSAGGGFVALWSSFSSGTVGDGSSAGIFMQRFEDASPAPYEPTSDLLDERLVNLFTDADQDAPASVTLADGSYVLVWTSTGQDGDSDGIFAQRFNASGERIGPEFQANTQPIGQQYQAEIGALSDGGFVIAWTANTGQDGSGAGVFAQRYDATGATVGGEFQVNTETSSTQDSPVVAGLSGGGFVVIWDSNNSGTAGDGSGDGVFGQRYDAAGSPAGSEFQVNTEFSGSQNDPAVSALGTGFIVTWTSSTSGSAGDGSGLGVFAQRYDASGTALGTEFQVNVETASTQNEPAVVELAGGNFAVVWTSTTNGSAGDGSGNGVFARIYDADGTALTGEVLVNTTTSSNQEDASIAALSGGGFVVTWADQNNSDGSSWGVFGQEFDASGTPVGAEFQVNQEFSSVQYQPTVTGLANDTFAVAWSSLSSGSAGDGSGYGVFQRLFGDASDFTVQADPDLEGLPSVVNYLENTLNAAPQLIDANGAAAVSDMDSADFDGGQLVVSRLVGFGSADQFGLEAESQEQLGIRNQGTASGEIGVSGSSVSYGGTIIGSILSNGSNGNDLIVEFNSNATAEAVEALAENLTYQNTSSDPVPSRQYTVQISDGDGGSSEPHIITVNIEPETDGAAPVFGERQTNSFVSGSQEDPAVAALADGGYVIVWGSDGQDGSASGVFGQRYNADGVLVGPEFLVNSNVLGSQIDPQVAGLAGGGFVVTWTDQDSHADGSSWGVKAQQYAADASLVGSEFIVNTTTSSTQYEPAIAALNDGGYVIAYRDGGNADGSSDGVFAQRYDASGATVDSEFQVNTENSSNQFDPSVASLADGGFVVTWTSTSSGSAGDGNGWGTFGQRYDAAGNAVGGEFQVNTNIQSSQYEAVVTGLTGGDFVVTWRDDSGLDGSGSGIFAQVYDAGGAPVGGEFRVNETTSNSQTEPAIAALDNGGFTVAWRDSNSADDIFAQQYDAAGNRIDGEFRVNTETASTQASPSIAGLPGGNFVVAWQSFTSGSAGDGDSYGISHQLFGDVGDFSSQAAPVLEAFNSEVTFAESAVNAGPQLLDANAAVAVSDADSGDFDGGNILVSRLNIPEAMLDQFNSPDDGTQDQLGVRNQGSGPAEVGVSGASVTYGGTVVGTIVSNGQNGSTLEISLNANASAEAVEAVVENLTYANTSDDPIPSRQFRVQISDGDGGTSQPQVVTVNINPTADAAVPIFGERQANTETDGYQDESAVTALSDGTFVIVWTSQSSGTAGDGDNDGVFGQHFDELGNRLGAEFQVNTETASAQNNPQVTATSDGGFVVVWQSASSGTAGDGSGNAVIARQFDGFAGGGTPTASSAEVVVNTNTSSAQDEPDVVALPDGGFVVVWESQTSGSAGDGSGVGIIGQIYDASGAAVGGEFVVNTETASSQYQPKVTALSDGGFLVAWTSVTSGDAGDGDSSGIFAQRYDAVGNAVDRDGTALGAGETGEFQVNVTVEGTQDAPDVAGLAGGGFILTWESNGQDGSGEGIYARQFADNGLPVGNEFRVNDERSLSQQNPAVIALDTGGYVITWSDNSGRDGSGIGVFGQQYDASGNRLDSEFQVNTESSSTQHEPALSALPGGGFVVSWSAFTSGDSGDGSGYGVFYQLYGNAPPQVTDGSVDGFEDQLLVLSDQLFVDNFDDPDGQGLAFIEIAVLPDNGELLLSGVPVSVGDQITLAELANGDLGYLGDPDYFGADTFGWRGSDGLVLSTEIAQTNITLAPVNDAPGLEAGAAGTSAEGQNFSRKLALSDPDSDTYTITVDWGDGSTLSVFNSASKSPNINHTYALEGTFTVTVTVNDNSAAANAEETDTFDVTVENGNPIARNDFFAVDEDASVSGNVLLNNGTGADSDTGGDILSIAAVNGAPADIGSSITLSSGALLTLNADGTFNYDTNGAFDSLSGTRNDSDSFTYTLSDGEGGTDTATVNLTINGLNDDPIAQDDNVGTNEDAVLNGNVLVNNGNGADEDIDGGIGGLSVVAVNGSTVDVGTVVTLASGALLTLNANGTFNYDPNGQFDSLDTGETGTDSFTYTIEDEGGAQDTATVNVTVDGMGTTNTPPVAQDDSFTTDEDTAVAGNVLSDNGSGADSDADGDTLTVTTVGTFATTGGGLININADGSFNYSPNAAFEALAAGESDADSFTYTLSDGNGGTDTAAINFVIDGVNDGPVAEDDAVATDEDSAVNGNVLADNGNGGDSDPDGDTLTVTQVNGNALNVGSQITLASGALLTLNANGAFDYDPNGQFENLATGDSTTDSFTYTISDGNGGTDMASATITIDGVNDAPEARDDTIAATEDGTSSGNVLGDNGNGADSDIDGDTLTVTTTGTFATSNGGQVTLNANGTFTYDPSGAFESLAVGDTDTDSFSYTLDDGNGGTDTATVTLEISGANDDPEAIDDDVVTDEDSPVLGNVLADNGNGADSDIDGDTLTVASAGTFATSKGGQVTLNADGTFTYDPNGAFESLNNGDADTDSFSYTISDGNGGTDTATVNIVINGVTDQVANQAPDVVNDNYSIHAGEILSITAAVGLLSNDSDADGDALSVNSIQAPANGTLNIATDGSFTYTPDPGFVGTEDLTYTVSDGTTTSTGTVTIDVLPGEVETISLGDAPTRLPRTDRDAWSNAWTDASVIITHKADITDSGEAWSGVSLFAAGSQVLSGGDIYAGDLGVSGQAIETGQARQEIEGTEALRFELDGIATEATLEISRLDTEGAFRESGRVQALDDQGNVVAEVLFNADDLAGDQPVQISASQGFTQLVLTAGTYDGSTFVYGGLADDQGDYAAPADAGLSQGSDYLLDSVEFVFAPVVTEPEPLQTVAQSTVGDSGTTDVEFLDVDMPLIGIQEPEGPDQFA
jgi:hypothetical protein